MIKIERESPPNDTVMDRCKEEEYQKIEQQLKKKGKVTEIKPLWNKDKVIKEFLYKSQHDKCCFCERTRDIKRDSDVEHFRPKGRVEENRAHPGYWWLAYEWDNLLIACKKCNEECKKSKFPLKSEANRVFDRSDNLDKEEPYLINPLKEDPDDFIEYRIDKSKLEEELPSVAWAVGKCERGKKTVDELTGINCEKVHKERAKKLRECVFVFEMIETGIEIAKVRGQERIDELISPESTFAGLARFYFKSKGLL